jgi:hypothetical protein
MLFLQSYFTNDAHGAVSLKIYEFPYFLLLPVFCIAPARSMDRFGCSNLKTMKPWCLICLLLFVAVVGSTAQPAISQSVLASAGHFSNSTSLIISNTLGEAIIYGGAHASYSACQGFQSGQAFLITEVIDFESGAQRVTLFPNPVRDQLNIQWESEGDYIVQLFNVTGQVALSHTCTGASTAQIDMHDLPEGMYAVSFFSKNNTRHFAGWIARHL